MMRINCDHWIGYGLVSRTAPDGCQGEIPQGSPYFMILFADKEHHGNNVRAMRGGLHFCRPCMLNAARELSQREDITALEIRRNELL